MHHAGSRWRTLPGIMTGSEQTGDHSYFVNEQCKGLEGKREKAGKLSKTVNGLPAFHVCFEPRKGHSPSPRDQKKQ
ncbi:uncharacterized protein PgNI_09876 [Pyricularia grisea]|uniref:Uncharacterized protein n=1 Tax=Pyricularia grisea TaxID=148305 RepID=A0A6P8AS53_PYRGI|nr:uncharacterized protein PgNI_09876 [Pyricularia grisea]TLD04927.1 hypothetical protein PgNI_09876 [Pyricularia grisea]